MEYANAPLTLQLLVEMRLETQYVSKESPLMCYITAQTHTSYRHQLQNNQGIEPSGFQIGLTTFVQRIHSSHKVPVTIKNEDQFSCSFQSSNNSADEEVCLSIIRSSEFVLRWFRVLVYCSFLL